MDRLEMKAFVSDVLFVLALAIMFFSTVLPFASVRPRVYDVSKDPYLDMPIIPQPEDFSTFSVRYGHYIETSDSTHYYFGDYWFQYNELTQGPSFISNVLIVTFAMQVLTLVVGFAVFWRNRLFRVLPLLMWVSVTVLLTYVLSGIFLVEYSWSARFWPYVGVVYWFSLVATVLVSGSVVLGRRKRA